MEVQPLGVRMNRSDIEALEHAPDGRRNHIPLRRRFPIRGRDPSPATPN